jgi:hypothetical protein
VKLSIGESDINVAVYIRISGIVPWNRPQWAALQTSLLCLLLQMGWPAVSFQTCIQEVLILNLSRETIYPDWGFAWFSSCPAVKCQCRTPIRPRPVPSK